MWLAPRAGHDAKTERLRGKGGSEGALGGVPGCEAMANRLPLSWGSVR